MRNEIEDSELAERLEQALVSRNIERGFELLDLSLGKESVMGTESVQAIRLLVCLAQWVDLGYRDNRFFESVWNRFATVDKAQLTVIDFFRLTLADAFAYLASENLEKALSSLEIVCRAGSSVLPAHLTFLTHFWKGRVHRKRGEYADALLHISAARASAELSQATKLTAVSKIHQSWLVFQKGERRLAFQLLDEAEAELNPTCDALSLGNIESARGRFVRRSGEYAQALRHFEAAIAIYSDKHKHHPNLARALVNAAYVKRLIALDMKPRMRGGQAKGSIHQRYLALTHEALDLLRVAGEIYSLHSHQGGTGSVLVNAGHLHLESGDTEQAGAEALRAFALGEENNDQILMARARNLQSAVELARFEEQLGEEPSTSIHSALAVKYAEEAIELAKHTQNKRLLAEAYLSRGTVAATEFHGEFDIAKDFASKASALLTEDDRDHLFKELVALKGNILRGTGIDQTLRLWSDGQLGGKSFRQVQEEFAELVIPKVWKNLGRNITKVSQELSISPKKVRRILRNVKAL
jgi:tetratricopeptide (TPR) repeat protein